MVSGPAGVTGRLDSTGPVFVELTVSRAGLGRGDVAVYRQWGTAAALILKDTGAALEPEGPGEDTPWTSVPASVGLGFVSKCKIENVFI